MWCATIEQTLCPWVTNKERHSMGALYSTVDRSTVRTCCVDARRTTVQVPPVHLLNATRWGGGLLLQMASGVTAMVMVMMMGFRLVLMMLC